MTNWLSKVRDKLSVFTNSKLGPLALFLMAGFWIFAYFNDFAPLNLSVGMVYLIISGAVAAAYFREGMEALLSPKPNRGQVLALGIFVGWGANFLTRINGLGYRFTDDIAWLQYHGLTFLFFVSCLSGILHLLAPTDTVITPRTQVNSLFVVGVVAITALVSFFLGYYY